MKKDLLKLSDLTREEIMKLLNVADQMKFNQHHRLSHDSLEGKTLAILVDVDSARARVTFETGMYQLGGHAVSILGQGLLGPDEPPEDAARALSRYCDGIVIRTHRHADVVGLAQNASVPVINAGSDLAHPCQALADLMTLRERFSRLDGVQLCYVGCVSNSANSLIAGALRCGMTVTVSCPPGFGPTPELLDAEKLTLCNNPARAAVGADVIVTDLWPAGSGEHMAYQVNEVLLAHAAVGCVVLHSLPAHRGEEITGQVLEQHATSIFDAVENRLHVQKAALSLLMAD